MKQNEKDILNRGDPNKYIVRDQTKMLNRKHKRELRRAHCMYVKDPLSVAQIPAAINFAQTQTNKSRSRHHSNNPSALIHLPFETQRTNLTQPVGSYGTVVDSTRNTMMGNVPIRQTFTASGSMRMKLCDL